MDSSLYEDEEVAEIYNCHYDTVYRICLSFMKNAEDAEEHEKAWPIVTASNTCKDELRRCKRRLENIKSLFQQENVIRKEDDSVLERVMELSKWEELPEEVLEEDISRKEEDIFTLGGIEGNPEYMANAE